MEETEEAIVLRSIEFKERQRIITLLTRESGVLSLIVNGIHQKKGSLINLTTPLCRGEFHYRKGKSDLHRFLDGSIADMHLPLRQSYDHLEAASLYLQAIHTSQLPGKPAPILYALCASYLKQLKEFDHPKTLAGSFYLKILKHEGLIALHPKCHQCNEPAQALGEGENLCINCSRQESLRFTPEEWEELLILSSARSFDDLQTVELTDSLFELIKHLFTQRVSKN